MTTLQPPIDLKQWIEENADKFQPPVSNRYLYDGRDFFVMVIKGPNARNDFHLVDSEEYFYQLKGDIKVRIREGERIVDHIVKEGETFFIPPNVLHSPERPQDTIGIVVERRRPPGEKEHVIFYCENCGALVEDIHFDCADIVEHFGQAMLFYPVYPARWYVRLEKAPDMHTTPAAAAHGVAIDEMLPSGPDAVRFHALMNEAQMLLHEHPVNAEREARGELALNSIWFWGGGVIDAERARPFSTVFSDDPLARGLALAAGIPALALPKDAGSALAAVGDEGRVLAVADAPREAQLRGRSAALERDWFLPLLVALKSGRIGMLTLHLCGADSLLEVETVRSDLRYFWRRRKPLSVYA